jgi:hypothetical protein
MANCKRCGVSVGCGCQLTNGMCASCVSAVAQQQAIEAAQAIAEAKRLNPQ